VRKRFAFLLAWLMVTGLIAPVGYSQSGRPCPVTAAVSDEKFVPGQVWSFESREFEPDATLTVLKVESMPKVGVIVHVRLDGIRLRNCSGGPEATSIAHAPFTREAVERSVGRIIRTVAVPSFEDGYNDWKKHCGGAYTISVKEMVEVDEKTLNSGAGCSVQAQTDVRDYGSSRFVEAFAVGCGGCGWACCAG
jgi:hypothetical protein